MKSEFRRRRYDACILALAALAGLLATGCSRAVTGLGSNVDGKGWRQQEFILSTFHAVGGDTTKYKKILAETRAAGINLVELTFLSPDKLGAAMRAAEAAGVQVLAEDLSAISGIGDKFPSFTEETVRNTVNELKGYRSLAGYYIWDEPHERDFGRVRELRDLVKKHDAGRLAFSVVFPSYGVYTWEKGNYRWADNSYARYVDNYLKVVDPEVMSFDYYPFRTNRDAVDLVDNDMWMDFGYIRKKALEYNKPLWVYFQAVNLQKEEKSIMNLPRISAQMYAALAYGVKGLSYYNSMGSLLDEKGDRTAQYAELKSLNTDILCLGNFLLDKRSEYIYQTGVEPASNALYFLDSMESSDLLLSAPTNLVIGVLGDAGTAKYLMVSNKSHSAPVQGVLKFRMPVDVDVLQPGKQLNVTHRVSRNADSVGISLPAGAGALYIIKRHR